MDHVQSRNFGLLCTQNLPDFAPPMCHRVCLLSCLDALYLSMPSCLGRSMGWGSLFCVISIVSFVELPIDNELIAHVWYSFCWFIKYWSFLFESFVTFLGWVCVVCCLNWGLRKKVALMEPTSVIRLIGLGKMFCLEVVWLFWCFATL